MFTAGLNYFPILFVYFEFSLFPSLPTPKSLCWSNSPGAESSIPVWKSIIEFFPRFDLIRDVSLDSLKQILRPISAALSVSSMSCRSATTNHISFTFSRWALAFDALSLFPFPAFMCLFAKSIKIIWASVFSLLCHLFSCELSFINIKSCDLVGFLGVDSLHHQTFEDSDLFTAKFTLLPPDRAEIKTIRKTRTFSYFGFLTWDSDCSPDRA